MSTQLRELSLMTVHKLFHPGDFFREVYLKPLEIAGRKLAAKLGVSPPTLISALNGCSGISSDMALHLSRALGRVPER